MEEKKKDKRWLWVALGAGIVTAGVIIFQVGKKEGIDMILSLAKLTEKATEEVSE